MDPIQDKRWKDREQRWRAPGEVFNPSLYAVDAIEGKGSDNIAKRFIEQHHYSGSYPSARFRVGLYGPGARLVGVAVFSEPAQQAVVPCWTGFAKTQGAELGRLVLLDEVPYNAESWFVARALKMVREAKGFEVIVSYADPVERYDIDGRIVKPAHWGTIYQALNATLAGRARKQNLLLTPSGRVISPRALSKIRAEHRGWRYASKQLTDAGVDLRERHESLVAWLDRITPTLRTFHHKGNLAYVFGLSRFAKNRLATFVREELDGGLPYPKAA